jgi:diguanylate cyclase (GGDEF)-like protein/PAS domain S-box-containing protein
VALAEPIRVLIAEDVRTDAELSVRELRRAGLRIEHRIVDGEEAFRDALAEFSPQVVLSDFTMPQFDGMAALALCREQAPDVPFIFVSGTIGEEYAIRALKNGATDYVLKTNLVRLPAAVERALQEARERALQRQTERALAATREQLQSLLKTVPDVLWSVEVESRRVLYVSESASSVLGHAPEELLARSDLWVALVPAEDRPLVLGAWREAAGEGVYEVEHRILRPDGEVRWISARGRLVPGTGGAPARMDGVSRDITAQMEQQRRLARLSRVRDFTSSVNAALVRVRERAALFDEFCRIAVSIGGFALARVLLLDETGRRMRFGGSDWPESDPLRAIMEEFNRDPDGARSFVALAARSKKTVVSNDVARDDRVANPEELTRDGNYSVAVLPLRVGEQVLGLVNLRAAETDAFDDEEVRLLSELAGNLSFALELMEKQSKLDYLAYYDPLTGLANRALFGDRLAQAIDAARGAGHKVAALIFDLERFKAINDTLGTAAGDAVLQHVARVAVEAAGKGASLARLGGDQFALLLPAVHDAGEVGRVIEAQLARLLDTMLEDDGREVRIAAKAGVALHPDDGEDADTLLRNAEAALKKAKASGERFVFYAPQLNARVAERLDLEGKLRRAVERGEFALHFQPRVTLGERRITGVEALLRWNAAPAGSSSPATFVPVLEETGLIHPVGRWAMREALALHRAWRERGIPAPRVAVNVSAVQLRSRSFVGEVREALGGAGEAAGLDLEITESLLMENIEESLRKLREIRDLGVNIALDDFGTGYSSLGYLSRLPIDTLKIDRGFIRSMTEKAEDTSIVNAILSLARSLGLKVVAEGVETEEQARLLRLLRCEEMQGYLYSPPVPEQKLLALLASAV